MCLLLKLYVPRLCPVGVFFVSFMSGTPPPPELDKDVEIQHQPFGILASFPRGRGVPSMLLTRFIKDVDFEVVVLTPLSFSLKPPSSPPLLYFDTNDGLGSQRSPR